MMAETVPHIVIKQGGAEAAPTIADMHARLFDPPWNEASLSATLQEPAVIACLAQVGSAPEDVGFALCRVVVDEAEILTIGTLPAWRRRGIGVRLIDALAQHAAQRGAEKMFLEVAADNGAAQALYLKQGFAKAGERRGYYTRPGQAAAVDAAILVKRL